MASQRLEQQARVHDARIEALVAEFERQLAAVISHAQIQTVLQAQMKLAVTGDVIDRTVANQRVLRRIAEMFKIEYEHAGGPALVDSFVEQFSSELPRFQEVLNLLRERLKDVEQIPAVRWAKRDLDFFLSQKMNAVDQISGTIARAALVMQQKALFAARTSEVAALISQYGTRSVEDAARTADTALSVFYRNVAARGFEKIEASRKTALQYEYYGPDDKVTRPFCHRLKTSGKSYTKAEIEQMDNGQLPNPFVTGGGYNCRHQWILAEDQ